MLKKCLKNRYYIIGLIIIVGYILIVVTANSSI